jgi:hypothetical protein
MSDHQGAEEVPAGSGDTVVLEGVEYSLIPYGSERFDGVDIFEVPCHICATPPGQPHRSGCAMGPGRPGRLHKRLAECRDCGVAVGQVHVLRCGIEQCPRCGGQYMSCSCEGSEDSDTDQDDP